MRWEGTYHFVDHGEVFIGDERDGESEGAGGDVLKSFKIVTNRTLATA